MKQNKRLTSWKKLKTQRDKRHFHRVMNMEIPMAMYMMIHFPAIVFRCIMNYCKKDDVLKPYMDMLTIAKVRREVIYYRKKRGLNAEKIKMRYYIGNNYYEVRLKLGRKIKITEMEQIQEQCKTATALYSSQIKSIKGFYSFVLFKEPETVKEIYVDEQSHSICVGHDYRGRVMWNFDVASGALVCGRPRNGKTSWLMYLINSILTTNWELWVVDGKDVDYIAFRDHFTRYIGNDEIEDTMAMLRDFHQGMKERYALMHGHRVNKYTKLGLTPCFLIFDEYLSFSERVKQLNDKKKTYSELNMIIGDIVRRGPAGGYQIVLGMQRADTEYISGETRTNIQLKIVVGAGQENMYTMMFDHADSLGAVPVGYAWYSFGNEVNEMSIPFYEEIEQTEKGEHDGD